MDYKLFLLNILKGIGFGFLVYLISGDGGISIGLGLLIMYLEQNFTD